MSGTRGEIPHRLIPGTSVDIAPGAINLQVKNVDAFGFGTADWDQYGAPPAEGEVATITLEGVTSFEGKVMSASDPAMVGERLLYHVSCKGPAEDLKSNGTIEGVFIDRDLGQWHAVDSGWEGWSDGQINVEITDKIAFFWPTIEPDTGTDLVLVDTSEPLTDYRPYVGNTPPPGWHASDFPKAKALWTAAYYQIGGGATSKRISSVSFIPVADLGQAAIDALTTPDYDAPIAPVVPAGEDADFYGTEEAEVNHFATYPDVNLWSGLYGAAPPANCFMALYACDDLADLPTDRPDGMENDPHLIYKFGHCLYDSSGRVTIDVACKYLVWYAAYRAIRFPESLDDMYAVTSAHVIRGAWVGRTRLMAQRGQWAFIYGLQVRAQGYAPNAASDCDDLADVFRILVPGCDVKPMILPPPLDGSAGTTIAIRNATTLPAAVADLLALYPSDMSYGWWEGGVLRIRKKPDGAYDLTDEPGVDTTGAGTTSEGAVDLVLVSYMAPAATPVAGKLAVSSPSFLTVDAAGVYELVDEWWTPRATDRVVFVDGTGASGILAAARMGQSVAIEQRPNQGCGSVTLKAIAGASLVRPGCLLTGPGVAADTVVTGVSVDVGADTVSLDLGHSGYVARFPSNAVGVPLSTTPTNSAKSATSLDLRRSAG